MWHSRATLGVLAQLLRARDPRVVPAVGHVDEHHLLQYDEEEGAEARRPHVAAVVKDGVVDEHAARQHAAPEHQLQAPVPAVAVEVARVVCVGVVKVASDATAMSAAAPEQQLQAAAPVLQT
jgi:hypothetical protein